MSQSRTFRVFVSSTFADLVEERNALQRHVWPKLAQLCEKAGFRFQAIDLRWGVPSEAALDQRTSKICLQELERCQTTSPRPNFIILLGNRYGWRPLPDEIEKQEFEAIEAKSIELKLPDTSLLREWYRLDENAVPAVYYLRPRLQDTREASGEWWTASVEHPLRRLFLRCIDVIWTNDDPRRIDYERSLTEREILAGALNPSTENPVDHVFAYFRNVDYLDNVTKVNEDEAKRLRPYIDFNTATDCDTTARDQHRALKKLLNVTLGDQHIRNFEAKWTGTAVSQDHLNSLCDAVLNDLCGVIESEIAKFTEIKPLDAEIAAHTQFGQLRGGAELFKGRETLLIQISNYLKANKPNRPLVIFGPAGTGKSAVIARAAVDAINRNPHAVILKRFIGATPPSVDARSLLQSLCEELGRELKNNADVPLDYRELVSAFREHLALATSERPVILFLDAVDQLSETDNAKSLVWLPRQLPPHVRIVVSVLDDPLAVPTDAESKTPTNADPMSVLRRRAKEADLLPLEDYPREDAKALLDFWLLAEKRKVTASQAKLVLDAFERCPRPLFLKLAAEEAMQWRSDGDATKMPNADKPDEMLSAIINQLFDRLSEPSNHGTSLVERAIGYLVASKNGLTEDELLGLLSTDKEFFDEIVIRATKVNQPLPPGVDSLPVAVWVRLYSDIQPYLTTRRADGTTLLAFYHRSLELVARQRFLAAPEIAEQRHHHIAAWFTTPSFFRLTEEENRMWILESPTIPRPINVRKVSELPYQLIKVTESRSPDFPTSDEWQAVTTLLLNSYFLEASAEMGSIPELLAVYQQVLAQIPIGHASRPLLVGVQLALETEKGVLSILPTTLIQSLTQYCDVRRESGNIRSENSALRSLSELLDGWKHSLHLCSLLRPYFAKSIPHPALRVPIPSREFPLSHLSCSIAASPDGEFVAIGYTNGCIDIFDAELMTLRIQLAGHSGGIIKLMWSPSGQTLYTISADKSFKAWDIDDGALLRVLALDACPIDCALSKSGSFLAVVYDTSFSQNNDNTRTSSNVTIWSMTTSDAPQTLPNEIPIARSVEWSRLDDRLVIGSEDGTITVWKKDSQLRQHQNQIPIRDLRWHPSDNRIAFIAGESVGLWDLTSEAVTYYQPRSDSATFSSARPVGSASAPLPSLPSHFGKTLPRGFEASATKAIELLAQVQEKVGQTPEDPRNIRRGLHCMRWLNDCTLIVATFDGVIVNIHLQLNGHAEAHLLGVSLNASPEIDILGKSSVVAIDSGRTSKVLLWNVEETRSVRESNVPAIYRSSGALAHVRATWNCDGTALAVFGDCIQLKIWQMQSNTIHAMRVPDNLLDSLFFLDWSSCDPDLAISYSATHATILRFQTAIATTPVAIASGWIRSAFCQDRSHVGIAHPGGILLLSTSDGRVKANIKVLGDQPSCMAFAPNGISFAVGYFSGTLRFYSPERENGESLALTENGEEIFGDPLVCIEFSNCGSFLALGTQDGTICIFGMPERNEILSYAIGKAYSIAHLSWSDDSTLVAAALLFADNSPSVAVVHVPDGKLLIHIDGADDAKSVINWLLHSQPLLISADGCCRAINGQGVEIAHVLADADRTFKSSARSTWLVATQSTGLLHGEVREVRMQAHLLDLRINYDGTLTPPNDSADINSRFVKTQKERLKKRIVELYRRFEPLIQMAIAAKKWDRVRSLIAGLEPSIRYSQDSYALESVLRYRLHVITLSDMSEPKSELVLELAMLLRQTSAPEQVAEMLVNAASELRVEGRSSESLVALDEAESVLRPLGFSQSLVTCIFEMAQSLSVLGCYEAALRCVDDLETLLEPRDLIEALQEAIALRKTITIESLGDLTSNNLAQIAELDERLNQISTKAQFRTEVRKLVEMTEKLLEHDDLEGAIRQYERIIRALRRFDDRLELAKCLSSAGNLFGADHQYDRATEYLSEARRLFTDVLDEVESAKVGVSLAMILHKIGRIDDAYEMILESEGPCRSDRDTDTLADLLIERAELELKRQDFMSCVRCAEEALTLKSFEDSLEEKVQILAFMAEAMGRQGDFVRASVFIAEGIALCRQPGSERMLLQLLDNQAMLFQAQGMFDLTIDALEHRRQIAERLGDHIAVAKSKVDCGIALMRKGLLEEALHQLKSAEKYCREQRVVRVLPYTLLQHAYCLNSLGRRDEALQVAVEANDAATDEGMQYYVDATRKLIQELE